MSLFCVITKDMKVMRVMRTEKGAKKYATIRGLFGVGLMDSPSTISKIFRRFGTLNRREWVEFHQHGKRSKVSIFRGRDTIEQYFTNKKGAAL